MPRPTAQTLTAEEALQGIYDLEPIAEKLRVPESEVLAWACGDTPPRCKRRALEGVLQLDLGTIRGSAELDAYRASRRRSDSFNEVTVKKAARVQRLRERLYMTQEEVGELVGVCAHTISRIETRGYRNSRHVDEVIKALEDLLYCCR